MVMGLHDLSRCLRGGGDDVVDLAEPEMHERPMLQGQLVKSMVGDSSEQVVDVAYEWELPGGAWG